MNRDLQICLNTLESGSVNKDSFKSLLQNFLIFTQKTENTAGNREDVAQVYCLILSSCQTIYKITSPDKLPEDIKEKIIKSYNNIERLYVETNAEERNGSYVRTIWFLSELKSKSSEGRTGEIDHTVLGEYAKDLLDILGDIQFIFDIENEKGLMFPINKVIAAVIGGRDFQEFRNGVKKEDIYTLQLAVRLFRAAEDENILTTLKTKYHLAFIDYLNDYCEIIDTVDFLNYQYNGTIIFFNEHDRKVLIRSEREGYFSGCEFYEHNVISEFDCNGKSIGWFVEYSLNNNDVLCDYSDCLDKEHDRIPFLRLVYDKNYRNVFLQKAIIRKADNTLIPINPYCGQDHYLIQGRLKGKEGKAYRENQIRDLLNKYRVCSVKSRAMNRVTFGLCSLLLDIKNIGVNALGLDNLTNSRWYQEQVISNWSSNPQIDHDNVAELLREWCQQLEYCELQRDLENAQIKAIDLLPLQQDLHVFYSKLWPSMLQDELLLFGKIKEEKRDVFAIEVDLDENQVAANRRKNGERFITISKENLQDDDNVVNEWGARIGTSIHFLYSIDDGKGHIVDNSVLKALHGVESIQRNSLPITVGVIVTESEYERFASLVKLFEDTYRQIAKENKVCRTNDLDSQIYLRILHNMIWSGVDSVKKKDTYFDIVFAHQIADYEGIDQDPTFLREEDTVLYVPKDSASQGSVLSKLYGEYLKPVGRDPKYLYIYELTKNENDQYLVNEYVISRVILLTDNVVSGTSTIHAIAAYMGISSGSDRRLCEKRLKKANKARQKYCWNGEEVSIKTILTNNQVEFSVYSYYGTEKGIKKIEDFLKTHNIASSDNKYAKELTKKADQCIIGKATSIWNECELHDGHYLYIRKYNMPKKSIFPPQMLDNPKLFINVFYRSTELYDM